MAKVSGPLFSIDASGKIADALVYFPWKGRKVVRQWLKPTNPRDVDQKLIRQKLASMGKNLKAIVTPYTGLVGGSKMYQLLVAAAPAGQIWNAEFAKQALDHVKTDANFIALSSAVMGTDTVAKWREMATQVGLDTLTGVGYATTISPEIQLACGAYAAFIMALSSNTNVYTSYPSFWTTDMIEGLACDYVTISA